MKTDLLGKYLNGYAPYISKLTYDLDEREVVFDFEKRTFDSTFIMRLTFEDVLSFKEETFEDALDKNLTDSIMGMHLISDGVYCVITEKRELVIRVGLEPHSKVIQLST